MLTAKEIENAKPRKTPYRLWDENRSGFGVSVSVGGKKMFFFAYTSPKTGKRRFWSFEQVGAITLQEARDKAAQYRQKVREGIDPQDGPKSTQQLYKAAETAEKEREKAEAELERLRQQEAARKAADAKAPTVAEAAREYVHKRVSGMKRANKVARYFERDLVGALGDKKLKDVTTDDVLNLLEEKAEKAPVAAARLLTYLKGFFRYCRIRNKIKVNPIGDLKSIDVNVPGKKNALQPVQRERVLSDEELRTFWNNVETCGMHKLSALALKLVLLTGQRPGEVVGMHMDEIEDGVWTIPAERRGKTETPHKIPLTDTALRVIEATGHNGGFVFAGWNGTITVDGLSKAVRRYADMLGNPSSGQQERWRPHDLRRTARTRLAELGVSDEVGEMVIGHVKKGMVKTYNRAEYVAKKGKALVALERHILDVVGEEVEDNVVQLRG